MKIVTGFVLLVLLISSAIADVIELNNGKKMEGSFIGREGDGIKFDVDGITMTFNAADVKNISMGSAASAIVIDGVTVVPVDSNVYGVVLEATKSRRLAGKASIKLGVTDIRINGVMHKIKTTALTGVGEQTAKKSVGQVGKWAA